MFEIPILWAAAAALAVCLVAVPVTYTVCRACDLTSETAASPAAVDAHECDPFADPTMGELIVRHLKMRVAWDKTDRMTPIGTVAGRVLVSCSCGNSGELRFSDVRNAPGAYECPCGSMVCRAALQEAMSHAAGIRKQKIAAS